MKRNITQKFKLQYTLRPRALNNCNIHFKICAFDLQQLNKLFFNNKCFNIAYSALPCDRAAFEVIVSVTIQENGYWSLPSFESVITNTIGRLLALPLRKASSATPDQKKLLMNGVLVKHNRLYAWILCHGSQDLRKLKGKYNFTINLKLHISCMRRFFPRDSLAVNTIKKIIFVIFN